MYSVSKMKFDRKPPLAKSPTRLRPRRALRSNSTPVPMQTPPGSLTKSEKPSRRWDMEESELRPEYRSISCELRALARMVSDEFGKGDSDNTNGGVSNSVCPDSSTLFERGRFYEEYSAKRNERLRRKKSEARDERRSFYNLGVNVESAKRGSTSKKIQSLRRSVSAAYSVEKSEIVAPTPRYMLRSMSKENKKPPLATTYGKSVIGSERKVGARRVLRD
ncbi:hypothetical protein RGQ29_010034 [Quercus rubra]|uniref:Uncharacterized protein n=1 Tax=Quercus rubra TaxID=3512 RepID=A0AAN7J6U5_QUERU|nr:hypothetical protein RGQ29_010034 [Quercus rubra]